ncbi:BTAD domain-containing putative transcriptional regulator [Corallococcus sp. BB11-1]|uniref:tetratricopeptide repeat protein n=1 Tax=Corallococcus sp. BB11-1 TaxID=2996783 RepID=UPI002271974E|nr:BTAD domain-containing putative transcriptional regulator [Corallococcus sp. BB11-1]MCY1029879.1 BTAD domain-containing putative transcriptional regulator [Corallococcus sp. BB11-1]
MSEREKKLRELKETAHALYQRGRYSQCVETYSQLVRLLPHDANVRVRLAEACRRAGQRAQAITAYRDAATILMLLGCAARARGALKAALELDPRDPVLQMDVVRLGQGEVISTLLEDEQACPSTGDFFDRLPPTPPPGHMRSMPPPPPPAFVLNAAQEANPSGGLPAAPPITPMTASGTRSTGPGRMQGLGSGPGREALLPHHRPVAPATTPARGPETATELLARSLSRIAAGDHTQAPTPVQGARGPGIATPARAPTPGPVPPAAQVQGATPAVNPALRSAPAPHGAQVQGATPAVNPARAPSPAPVPHGAPVQGSPSARPQSPGPAPRGAPVQGPSSFAIAGPVPRIAPVQVTPLARSQGMDGAQRSTAPASSPSAQAASQKALPGALLALPALPQTPAGVVAPTALTPVSRSELPPERPTVKVIALLNRAPEALPTPPPPAPLPRSQLGHPHASSLTMPPLATLPYRPEMRRLAPNVVALRVSPQARWVIIRSDSDLQVSRSEALPGDAATAP